MNSVGDSNSDFNSANSEATNALPASDTIPSQPGLQQAASQPESIQQPTQQPAQKPTQQPAQQPATPSAPVFSNKGFSDRRKLGRILLFSGIFAAVVLLVVGLTLFLTNSPLFSEQVMSITNVEATKISNGIVAADSTFRIATENGSLEDIRTAIYLEPAIDYEITEVNPGTLYEITPTTNLTDNIVLNIDSVKNEVISYKWAFQTKKDLTVSKIYPANGANYVSENSVIEFSFSYPDVENVEDHFSISPQVSGKLEKSGLLWRFTSDAPFAANTTYEVKISAGLTYGEETMADDFYSSFSTFAHSTSSSNAKNQGITLDGVSVFTETESPAIVFMTGDEKQILNNSDHVTVEQVNSADDYIKYLKGEQINTSTVGDYQFDIIGGTKTVAILKQTLPTGYYIFRFKSSTGQTLYTTNIEVNNLSAYAFESERDCLVWVAEDEELKSGVKVNFKGKDYETGADGLLTIKDISDFSGNLEYLKIGGSNQPLVVALKNFENNLYPQGFIYTDRPLYTPNDTIKIWGYIPLAFFRDAPNRDNFSLVLDDIKKQISIDSEGFFSTEIQLDNHKDISYGTIALQYNDVAVAKRNISVEDYTLENYSYEFVAPKNYVNAGENINFTVKVSHVTGFPAINKDIVVTYKEHDYYGTTNGQGEASFSLPTSVETATWAQPQNYTTEEISIKSGGAEYNKYSTRTTIYIFKNNIVFESSKDDKNITFTAQTLNLGRNVNTSYGYSNLVRSNFSGPATLHLIEYRYERKISGYRFNEYTKENVPVYETNSTKSVISDTQVNFEDGKFVFKYPTKNFKESTENVRYSYAAAVGVADSTARPAFSNEVTYFYNNYYGESGNQYGSNAIVSSDYYNPVSSWLYNLYRFGLKDTNFEKTYGNKYSIGDILKLGLYDYNGNIENLGKVLAISYKEDITNSNIFEDETTDLEFNQDFYPGSNIAGAYFQDGKFYRIAPNYYDYNESDAKLNVNVETSEQSFAPGDTVKAKIIVTNPDGSRANGRVNLSVVNEAIFSAGEDNTSILSSIYANKSFKSYSMSTYYDYELYNNDGRGAAGGWRSNFGDTIFFGEKTLNNGEAEFEFELNDSITSFRLTALAVENSNIISAGVGTKTISSSLPLSISTVMPKKVKKTDDLVLNATSITSGGNNIEYTFKIEELDKTLTAGAIPGQSVSVNFGKLDLGKYTVTISAKDSAGNEDKMEYPLEVIETAQEISIKKTMELGKETEITPTKNPIILEIYDKSTKKYLTYLDFLESHFTARLDTIIAYYKAIEYKNKYYNEDTALRKPDSEIYITEAGLLKSLENAEGDYVLTALANYYASDYFDLKATNFGIELDDSIDVIIKKLLVLASFKEPVLVDLRAVSDEELSSENKLLLALAFAFIGDYNSAKEIYNNIHQNPYRSDLLAVLSTFIGKNSASSDIDDTIAENPTAEYLPFAIISYFENNEVDLNNTSTVTIKIDPDEEENDEENTEENTEEIEISPLVIAKRILYIDDLSNLKFTSTSEDNLVTYYYQGKVSELGEDFVADINAYLEGDLGVGQTATLVLDISALTGNTRNGELNIALPSSLKFSATFSGVRGLGLALNNNEYIKLSLNNNYEGNTIRIPLYVAFVGNYEFEPIVFIEDGNYHLSNSFSIDLH